MKKLENKNEKHQTFDVNVSVIIPIYNAKATILECLKALITQTYKQIEIILVDDGSTDGSKDEIESLIEKDKRIFYYRKNNEGVSAARNMGLMKAKGKYIMFVDADDVVHCEMIKTMVDTYEKSNADLVVCKYTIDKENIINKSKKYAVFEMDRKSYLQEIFIPTKQIAAFVWNRLYKADLISANNLCFDVQVKVCEDTLFNYCYAMECAKIVAINTPLYFYNINDNSAMFSPKFNLNKLTANMAYDYMLSHENNKQIISYIEIACMQFNEIINFQIITQNIPIGEDVKRDIKHRLRLNAKAFLKANISFKYKLAYPILAYLWPR